MTLQTQRRNEIVDNVVQCRSLNGFKRIHDTHIEGVIWNREFPSTVSSFIDSINIVGATDSRFCSSVDDVAEKAAMTLQALGKYCPPLNFRSALTLSRVMLVKNFIVTTSKPGLFVHIVALERYMGLRPWGMNQNIMSMWKRATRFCSKESFGLKQRTTFFYIGRV
jgi:hypothetical protein